MKTVCNVNACNGCMACVERCKVDAIRIHDEYVAFNAIIDETKCVQCDRCTQVCPNNHDVITSEPLSWQEGWSCDEAIRKSSASGGIASAIIKSFIEDGGYVCSCCWSDGDVKYKITNDIRVANLFSGSKYVKSNPAGIYLEIQNKLKTGEKVLFVGLPCQVDAVKRYVPSYLQEQLYTIDLICHGTPSPLLLRKFLEEEGINLNDVADISFRNKNVFKVTVAKKGQNVEMINSYIRLFLHSEDYTENCYACRYAKTGRVSDLTLGDSWGTSEEDGMKIGVSLVLCISKKGKQLIQQSSIHLQPVNKEKAIEVNRQLVAPSQRTKKVDKFFRIMKYTRSFRLAALATEPYYMTRQYIKKIIRYK